MKITRVSTLSGKTNSMELNITEEQLIRWKNGEHIQNVVPNMKAEEREFIISGITPKEWKNTFGMQSECDFEDEDEQDNNLGGTGHGDISYSDADNGL